MTFEEFKEQINEIPSRFLIEILKNVKTIKNENCIWEIVRDKIKNEKMKNIKRNFCNRLKFEL